MPPLSNAASFTWFLPELVLAGGILVILLAGLVWPAQRRHVPAALAAGTAVLALLATRLTPPPAPMGLFGGLVARDLFGDYFKLLACASAAIVALLAIRSREVTDFLADPRTPDRESPEFAALLVSATLGVLLLATATDLLMVYLALEWVSLMSYVMTGFTRGSRRSSEAALKYIIYGSVASGAFLYGLSLLYGLAGSTELGAVRIALAQAPPEAALAALGLTLAGLGYKVAVVPFHMWCPDVYEGAPTPVTAFLSVAPKAGGLALVMRFFGAEIPTGGAGAVDSFTMLAVVIGVVTMTVGNLSAMGQTNIKRLLAYSSIAHAGYLFLGVAAGAPGGHQAVLFYLGLYLFMSLLAFGVVVAVVDRIGGETIDSWRGLGRRMPLPAFAMTVALFALAGLPPTAGFIAKFTLFRAVIAAGAETGSGIFYVAALLAVLNTVVSLYYYVRIIRAMYLDSPPPEPGHAPAPIRGREPTVVRLRTAPLLLVLLIALTAPVILLGLFFGPLDALSWASLSLWLPPLP